MSSSMAYQICRRCIMDTSDPDIRFDLAGICNHCHHFDQSVKTRLFVDSAGQEKLQALVERMKRDGSGKEYDCLMGVSGGVDSTYVAYTVRKLGLRVLAVHLDNGWNSELAVRNIERTVKALGIDLFTYVIDWEEFKDLQMSFLKASVANCEIPSDHAILAILFRMAAQKGIRYIMSGSNIATEGVLPNSWGYDHKDWTHIKGIHRRFGTHKLKTYPHYTLADMAYYTFVKGVRFIQILNYLKYDKAEAMKTIQEELGWQYYGGKHYESIYTRFFQAYILPIKFKIDKRRAHYSSLVCSGQMTRDEALADMKEDPYPTALLEEDREYVLKKLGLTDRQFAQIMAEPVKSYREYPSNEYLLSKASGLVRFVKRVLLYT